MVSEEFTERTICLELDLQNGKQLKMMMVLFTPNLVN